MSDEKSTHKTDEVRYYQSATQVPSERHENVTAGASKVGRVVTTSRSVGQLAIRITTRPDRIRRSTE